MGYYLHLAKQYMWHNKARTLYSVLGIALTFIMCYGLLTAFYSFWDYKFLDYYRQYPYELWFRIQEDNGATPEMIRNVQAMEKDEAIEKLTIYLHEPNGQHRLIFPSDMKLGAEYDYSIWIKLNDTSDLRATADMLSSKYHFGVTIRNDVAVYLRQDESAETALVNLLITLSLMIFGGFFVAILRNTMMISVAERVRDHGLFRCVGMSEGQLRILLFTEGIIMSLVAALIGTGIGYWLMKVLEPWISETLELSNVFSFRFYPKAVLITCVLVVAVTLFSLIEPSRQSGLVSPLDALHGTFGGSLKKKKRKSTSGGLSEKFFGAAGFYAKCNSRKGNGQKWALFTLLCFSVALILGVYSFSETFMANIRKHLKYDEYETNSEYREDLHYSVSTGHGMLKDVYDQYEIDRLLTKLSGISDVKDTIVVMHQSSLFQKNSLLRMDPHIREIAEKGVGYAYEFSYEAEDMEKERDYLVDGKIDYERMKAENGVLICDRYASGQRFSEFKVGDAITALKPETAVRVRKRYLDAIRNVAERNEVQAWQDEISGYPVYIVDGKEQTVIPQIGDKNAPLDTRVKDGADDTEFVRLREEVLAELKKQGYDCAAWLKEDSINMRDIMYAMQEMEYEKGNFERYTVMGILSDDKYYPVQDYETAESGHGFFRIIYPVDTVLDRIERVRAEITAEGGRLPDKGLYPGSAFELDIKFDACIGIRRDAEFLDGRIRKIAAEYTDWRYGDSTGSDEYYFAMKKMKPVKLIVVLAGGFIITVCMIQMMNTLQADMRLRKKELWLYDVVGMDPADRFKMQLIEHGMVAAAAIIAGMIASFAVSFIFIKKLMVLDWKGQEFIYRWPWHIALLLSVGILGVMYIVNRIELKRSQRNGR